MSYDRPRARRENAPVLIGLSGTSGAGKTCTAMELATGLAGGKRFAVIDTENGRAKHYADEYDFAHVDLRAPFRPSAYADAIKAEDEAGAPVIVVDQASHEHAGEGGLLDWHDDELDRLTKGDNRKRDSFNRLAWVAPKSDHKRVFVPQLLKTRAHLILCFRAEQKTDQIKGDDGKTKFVPKDFPGAPPEFADGVRGWGPIAEKNLIFEMTASFLFLADFPGRPIPIKCPAKLRPLFPDDKCVGRAAGESLAAWARGETMGAPVAGVPAEDARPRGQGEGRGQAVTGAPPTADELLRVIEIAKTTKELGDYVRPHLDKLAPADREKVASKANEKREQLKQQTTRQPGADG